MDNFSKDSSAISDAATKESISSQSEIEMCAQSMKNEPCIIRESKEMACGAGPSSGIPRASSTHLVAISDATTKDSVSSQSEIEMCAQSMKDEPCIIRESKEMACGAGPSSDIPGTSSTRLISAMDEFNIGHKTADRIQKVGEFSGSMKLKLDIPDIIPHSSSMSTPKNKNSFLVPKSKVGTSSTSAGVLPFKEFSLGPSDLPFTKEQLAETLSLEEASGFLPYIMKTKRGDLRLMENQLDRTAVDIQVALRDAKHLGHKLLNVPETEPVDMNDAIVQAQKLLYLLSSSFRVFEKLQALGTNLKESIQVYSETTGEYHLSVDVLLEYIVECVNKKCTNIEEEILQKMS